jgi:hypothetical protein
MHFTIKLMFNETHQENTSEVGHQFNCSKTWPAFNTKKVKIGGKQRADTVEQAN